MHSFAHLLFLLVIQADRPVLRAQGNSTAPRPSGFEHIRLFHTTMHTEPVTGHAYNSGAHVRVPPKNMPFFTHPFAYSQLTLLTWTWSWLFGYSIRPNSNLQLMESRRMTSQSVGFRNLGMFGQGTYSPYTYALISLA